MRPFGLTLALIALLAGAVTVRRERVAAPAVGASVASLATAAMDSEPPLPVAVVVTIDRVPEVATPEKINASYYDWARRAPEDALAAATTIADDARRRLAIQSALSGWARVDPSTLADTALSFPDGEEKNAALTKAFRYWMIQDPEKAGNWILAHPAQVPIAENVFRTENR